MTLADYMKMANVGDKEMADKIGVQRSMVVRLRNGSRRPSWDVAEKIRKVSKGAVGFEEWANGK